MRSVTAFVDGAGELGLPTTRIDVVGAGSVVGTDVARATAIADDAALRASVRGRWGAAW
ncbi:hypothetical protein [Curtobacterium sp. MCJR17_043]|uniref:hypothetical protein n=1 Tax=Curtobacterium sp. MCJR17_043 TaxID=2175660 RepID=UPI0024DFA43A|nr:hypothetical protein [Curtobacterium sp. MCJR17_043]WIB36416.1 hypothetical protein DEJ15_04530 [Curtobacterium sp. MCJR17_043]